jgi:RHS repeat-associated protein
LIETSEYEPYGKLLNRPLTDGPGFTGHVQDAATDLTYMQQRYYDPVIGRFLSVDSVTASAISGENFNRYWYGNNNPYKFFDLDGRCTGSHIANDDGTCVSSGDYTTGGSQQKNFRSIPYTPVSPTTDITSMSSSNSNDLNATNGAPMDDGRIPVPGAVGWKTGQYTSSRTGEELDREGRLIAGVAIVGSTALIIDGSIFYGRAALSAGLAGVKGAWKNLSFDGPSPGGLHANGRLAGVRWKGSQWGMRLDLHPINSGKTPILHINFGPPGRGEAAHIVLFDPRWIKK